MMYRNGSGVIKDTVSAHMWFNVASANGMDGAGEERDSVEIFMTADAIEKATAMARECMASDYKKCGY